MHTSILVTQTTEAPALSSPVFVKYLPLLCSACGNVSGRKQFSRTQNEQIRNMKGIILGTHREKGAYTFWSYAVGLPLPSSAIISWKFCHVLHKIMRDGHPNVSINTRDRHGYGQLVSLYSKLLCTKMEFHTKHSEIPASLEVTDEVLERTAGTDINNVFQLTVEVFDYMDAELRLAEAVLRQLNMSIAISTLTSGQCKLAPLIQVIQDCSHLYHYTVKLLFKLHACLPADTLQGHRERFHEQFHSLKTFLNKARDMLYFKRLIQIPRLPDVRKSLIYILLTDTPLSTAIVLGKVTRMDFMHWSTYYDLTIVVSPCVQAQRYITQLKSQINSLETELEEQRVQKQRTLVENEQLRMELEALRRRNTEHESMQTSFVEADKRSQATELRYNKLKENTFFYFLMHSISKKDADLSSLMKEAQLKEYSLQQERDRTIKELGELQGKLKEKLSHEEQLQQKLLDEQFALLQATVTEAENIIQDAVATLDDPLHISSSSSPDYLISRAEATLNSIDKLQVGHSEYVKKMRDAGNLVRALTKFSHLTADTIISGSATAHMAHTDDADRKSLTEHCKTCATQSLQYLKNLKSKASLKGADPTSIQAAVQKILRIGQDLRPKGIDVGKEELGDVVDKEMAATSAAIEEAVRRIDVSIKGTKLFIRHRKAIRLLVLASTDLQKEIVESGRGAASVREFYARNSRWTEGLISASKAVGWGATQMVDSADKVVLHTGKYEELIVCSHEIAASTAQLVAASKVKADRGSKKLGVLQHASRHVNEMAANVVASTKTGQGQIEDKGTMDFSGMSLIKLKKEEMESQVKVLELESMLENERLHLGELRKKHYEIAGVPLEELAQDNGLRASPHVTAAPSSPKPSKPTLMKKPALAQKPNIPPKTSFILSSHFAIKQSHL
uniref:Huntingtin interacting protein 1 related b n=1 Tax=Cyprinus carpio TaxID=7962 RepID=A0A8C2GW37_CYPCA